MHQWRGHHIVPILWVFTSWWYIFFVCVWHLAHLNNWRAKKRFLSTILCSVFLPGFLRKSDKLQVQHFVDILLIFRLFRCGFSGPFWSWTGRQWCDWNPWNHQDPAPGPRMPPKFAAVQPSKAPFQLILMDRCCERFRVPSHDNLRYYLTRKKWSYGNHICSVVVSNFSLRSRLQERFTNVNPAPVQVASPN